jgi:anti-anti-sigma factor
MTAFVPLSPSSIGRITVESEDGAWVLRLAGDIDATAVDAYGDGRPAPGAGVISVVDLTDVTFLSSSGVGLVIRQTQRSRELGHLPTLRGMSSPTRRILVMTGADNLFRPAA